MYYFLLALIDIGFYIAENWKQLTFTALASGIGMILGKRLGSRLAVRQIMKMLGLEKKSKLEQKVDFLIDIEKERGNVWKESGATEKSWTAQTTFLKKRYSLSQAVIRPLNKLRRNQNMQKFKSRKFILAVVGAILIILNEGLDMGIDSETVLAFAGLLAVWIAGESHVDAKRVQKSADYGDHGQAED